jgi:hypothetical protein
MVDVEEIESCGPGPVIEAGIPVFPVHFETLLFICRLILKQEKLNKKMIVSHCPIHLFVNPNKDV